MSKEIDLSKKIPLIVEFVENTFKEEDGINKHLLLKSVASYYESLVAAETTRTMIIQAWGKIQ